MPVKLCVLDEVKDQISWLTELTLPRGKGDGYLSHILLFFHRHHLCGTVWIILRFRTPQETFQIASLDLLWHCGLHYSGSLQYWDTMRGGLYSLSSTCFFCSFHPHPRLLCLPNVCSGFKFQPLSHSLTYPLALCSVSNDM